jgi:DNA polymerase
MAREDVYIANVLKCRPPNNRDPQQDEIDSCKDYLRRQIVLIDPRVVVTLGNFATKLLLRTETGITRLRGKVYPWWRGKQLIATFHPAAALRSTDLVTEMQRDFALIRSTLDQPPAPPPSTEPVKQDPEQMSLFA